jgi:hypothetical protein
VAVLGDGVNDVAALHVADVGMAGVTPEKGIDSASQLALWTADAALPSDCFSRVCGFIDVNRDVFATAHCLFFFVVTSQLQAALAFFFFIVIGQRDCWGGPSVRWRWGNAQPTSHPYLPLYAFVSTICLCSGEARRRHRILGCDGAVRVHGAHWSGGGGADHV